MTQLSKVTRFLSAAEETFWVKQSKEREREKNRNLLGWRIKQKRERTFGLKKLNKRERETNISGWNIEQDSASAREREREGGREREKQTFWVEILNVQLMLLKRTFQTRQVDNRQTSQIDRQRKTFWVEQILKVFYNRFRLNQTGRYKLTEREREKKKTFWIERTSLERKDSTTAPDWTRQIEKNRETERETRTLKER